MIIIGNLHYEYDIGIHLTKRKRGNSMNNNLLKENKIHGDTIFPLATYSINSSNNVLIDCHWHTEFELLIVKNGSIEFTIGTEIVTVKENEVIFMNSGELHTGYLKEAPSCDFEAVVFDPDLLCSGNIYDSIKEKYIEPIIKGEYVLPRVYKSAGEAWEKTILEHLEKILKASNEKIFGYEMDIKSRLLNIFTIIFSNLNLGDIKKMPHRNDVSSERLKKVMNFIYDNYSSRITIKELAHLLNMSEGHFIRFFKTMVRKTPIEYINYYRVNKAVEILENNDKKIIEISGDVGFENVSYFTTIFKHYMKCTPGRYRKIKSEN